MKISPKTPKIIALWLALVVNFAFFSLAMAQEPMVGEIRLWAGSTAPAGWAICDGTIIYNSLDYDPLLSVIGYNYGGAFELGYFQLPDLRGRVPVGRSDIDSAEFGSLGDTGGEKTHTLTTNEMPSHNHQYIDRSNSLRTDIDFHTTAGAGNGIAAGSGGTIVNRSPFIRNTGGGQPHNNLQPYQVVNYIIYTGVGLPTPTPTMTPTPTITPTLGPTATFTPMTVTPNPTVIFPTETPTGTMYLPSVLSQTLSSGHVMTVPMQVSAGEALISMVMLSVVGLVSLTVVYRVVKP